MKERYIPSLQRRHNAIGAKPVTHDHTVPCPFPSQNILQNELIRRAKIAIDAVIRSHDAPRVAVSQGDLEGLQVNLTESSRRNDLVDEEAAIFLVIGGKVLNTGTNSSPL